MPIDLLKYITEAFDTVFNNSIIVMEDFDTSHIVKNRDIKNNELVTELLENDMPQTISNHKTSLSTILNALDGISTRDGIITVITTNDKNSIDPALLRPGRIDISIELGYVKPKEFIKFIEVFYKNNKGRDYDNDYALMTQAKEIKPVTISQLQNYFMEGRTCHSLVNEFVIH